MISFAEKPRSVKFNVLDFTFFSKNGISTTETVYNQTVYLSCIGMFLCTVSFEGQNLQGERTGNVFALILQFETPLHFSTPKTESMHVSKMHQVSTFGIILKVASSFVYFVSIFRTCVCVSTLEGESICQISCIKAAYDFEF